MSDMQTVDGQALRSLAIAGLYWLRKNRDEVNALNVFPVPDGDTGTNMWHTMNAAVKKVTPMTDETHAGTVAKAIARGALMGARGNSGVILSQIWRGFSSEVEEDGEITAESFARGIQSASDTAYKGVMKPVEGTILTVIRSAGEAGLASAQAETDIATLLADIISASKETLAKTPDMLPILKQAGVVDSGGQGLVYIFEGMHQWVTGELDLDEALSEETAGSGATNFEAMVSAQELARPEDGNIENHYDVQYLLLGKDLDVEKVRADIDAMGDSTVVVGDSETIKVHIHVEDPGEPLTYGIKLGEITDIVVENMQEQMEEMIADHGSAAHGSQNGAVIAEVVADIAAPTLEPGQIGIVTTAPGRGLANALRDLGATIIVDGGQTNNPSTEELFQAIQDVPSDRVIILPNNKNIILAAESARDLSPKTVEIIPTRTVPQGLAAMMGYQLDGDLNAVVEEMAEAVEDVATAEITTAVRDVEIDGVAVKLGQLISIVDGKLRVAGDNMPAVLKETLGEMEMEERELVTLYYGADMTEKDAEQIVSQIEGLYPDVEVQILSGGQAHYHYILSAE